MPANKTNKSKIIKEFAISNNDTGSVQVQIALLTDYIKSLSGHLEKNPKDLSSKRGLLLAVGKRRTFLDYLMKQDSNQYKEIISRLGLRK